MDIYRFINENLGLKRQERGISIAELARRIGIDKKRLWYVLNGQREMRVDEFLKLCVALRIDPRSNERPIRGARRLNSFQLSNFYHLCLFVRRLLLI